jgi:RHS repeat-associated protein
VCPPGGDNFRFTGQEFDDKLGLHDYGARYYDQDLGRFLQIDSFLGMPPTRAR